MLSLSDVLSQPVTDENFSVIERVAHWVAALRMWEQAPWLGIGPGNYAIAYPAVRVLRWDDPLGHAHNIYLNTLGETGLVGLAMFLLFWGVSLVWVWRQARQARSYDARWWSALAIGVFGVLVHLNVHNFFDNLFVQGIYLHIALWLASLHLPGDLAPGSRAFVRERLAQTSQAEPLQHSNTPSQIIPRSRF
jgi:O-antigen ligase